MIDNIAGFVSGLAQTIVGHPLDTIKVWRQSGRPSPNMTIPMLYAGVTYPALTSGLLCSISFGVAAQMKENHGHFVSGLYAGAASGLLSAPIEYHKIGLQCGSGGLRGLRGLSEPPRRMAISATVARDMVGYATYFPVYYYLNDKLGTLTAGGIAGMVSWTVSYPLDSIKTSLQAGTVKPVGIMLWKGYLPCMLRAATVNAVGWYVYEKVKVYWR
jgi:solute carrier family 25 carnitine/acylcarnitine transporter 20/29